jgi:hypothetical protein
MKRFFSAGLLPATLLLLLTTVALAQKTSPFEQAQRHGDDIPGPNLYWTFRWDGKDVTVHSDGKGKLGGRDFVVPLNGTRITGPLRFAGYDGELLLLLEETDEESGAGKLVRFVSKTLKPKWECGIPGLNVGPGLLEGKSAYLSARGTAMKVNLETGKWDWRKTNLSRTGPAGEYRINAFELPRPDGDAMIFPEAPLDQAAPGRVILKKADGSIISVE